MLSRTLCLGLALSMSTFALPRWAHAQASEIQRAREHFRRATQLYDLQRYLEAAKEYELAYQAKEDPALLFNIGQSYRLAKEYASALGAFRSFLRNMPNTPNRPLVEGFIVEMKRGADEQARVAAEKQKLADEQARVAAEQARVAAERERLRLEEEQRAHDASIAAQKREPDLVAARKYRKLKLIGIGLAAGGGAVLVAGGGLLGAAGATASKYNGLSTPTTFVPSDETKFHTFKTAGIALAAVGGVLAIAGTAVAVVGAQRERRARFVMAPTLGPGYAGLDLGGAW